MQLSEELKEKIDRLTSTLSLSELAKVSQQLTTQYRSRETSSFGALSSDKERLAYLAARLPATYAVGCKVLEKVKLYATDLKSFLDIGAGPGTMLLAAHSLPLERATLIERDPGFIRLGKELCSEMAISQEWVCQDVKKELSIDPHDLVVASYVFNELPEEERKRLATRLWQHAKKFLIIIEPGTKSAFSSLKTLREHLIIEGAHLFAPCPHSQGCPTDWCHFSARVERSSLHRKVKDATLNYEDEKFSYLIFSKENLQACQARIVRHPYKGTGFVKFQICSNQGIEEKVITKKNKNTYLTAKKLEWGDELK